MDDAPENASPAVATSDIGAGDSLPPIRGGAENPQRPLGCREILAVLLLVVVSDLTIYRGHGFAGYALLFVMAPGLLWLGSWRPRCDTSVWVVGILLAVLAAKLLWCGSVLLVVAGFALLVAFGMALAGQCPYVLELTVFASQTIRAGYEGVISYARSLSVSGHPIARAPWLSIVLPAAAFFVFGMIFILANPDLFASFSKNAELVITQIRDWLVHFSLFEVFFWIVVLWISVGLLRPIATRSLFEELSSEFSFASPKSDDSSPSVLFPAFRNTLITVIVLFTIYLIFEFATLWFREFPEGFHYSGYAHEGAAWLTLALALATALLSVIFRGQILDDDRLSILHRLAWIWSIENFILALAVYNRMYIYIGFNGMTRMRMVGIFGMTAVVVGFALVLWKIAHNRDFVWLIRRHMWTLAAAVYLYGITPVDTIVVNYNVRRILAGDSAPSVQISVHPISSEGVLLLRPLLKCEDKFVREGVRAMLAQRDEEAEELAKRRKQAGWTTYQISDGVVLRKLRAARGDWVEYKKRELRDEVLRQFHDYAYRWY